MDRPGTPSCVRLGGGVDEDDDDANLLDYKYEYGFNPLLFLGTYLRRNSPVAIKAKEEKMAADLSYVRHRVAKCLQRETVAVELLELVKTRRSGVVHGPVAGEVTDCGAVIWAKVFRPGRIWNTVEQLLHLSCMDFFPAIDWLTWSVLVYLESSVS